jgi:hypothetical protein
LRAEGARKKAQLDFRKAELRAVCRHARMTGQGELESAAEDRPMHCGNDRPHLDHELRYWTKALGIDEKTLRAAVAAVGTSAQAMRTYLGKK